MAKKAVVSKEETIIVDMLPEEEAELAQTTPIIPSAVSKLQIKRATQEIGQWENLKEALAADLNAKEDWDLAVEIKRDDPLVNSIGTALGLDAAALDNLFISANQL